MEKNLELNKSRIGQNLKLDKIPNGQNPELEKIPNWTNRSFYAEQNCVVSWHPLRNNQKFTTNVPLETLNHNPRFFKCASGHLVTILCRIYVTLSKLNLLLPILHLHLISYLVSARISNFFQISLLSFSLNISHIFALGS